ncbi:hypothetical protein [Microbacterium sp. P04]|uniref:hypothetical protein n=1 Tax=Microbacterium sp. P04 TaxID=3366947 RepID=UPI00374500BA
MDVDDGVRLAAFLRAGEWEQHMVAIATGGGAVAAELEVGTAAEVASLIESVDLGTIDARRVHDALRESVDTARYWQEPDGLDRVAALPEVGAALARVASSLMSSPATAGWDAAAPSEQWAVDWRSGEDPAPLPTDPAPLLVRWDESQREEEERSQARSRDPFANWSGTWWSVPQSVLRTQGRVRDALELVEDSLGWKVATIVPVGGAGRTLQIQTAADWAELCRRYPFEVTASRRHDWFRVTGRDGRWLMPDWKRVSGDWDAVHLTTLGYLQAATTLITIDAEYASVIGGWAPDSTLWLGDVAREGVSGRQEWVLENDGWALGKHVPG